MKLFIQSLYILFLFTTYTRSQNGEYCVCTTVECPQVGENNIIMGQGGANMTYIYESHLNYPVVVKAEGTITQDSLHNGSDTTSCTRSYARMLEDDGEQSCDAGHILANRLGGYGNQPLNIFPQNSTINQGVFQQFESKIYDCMLNVSLGYLKWEFLYESDQHTQPNKVTYYAEFEPSSLCGSLYSEFSN